MSFSFGQTAGASQSTAKPRLEGNNIYDVVFDGCEIEDIQGVKDPSQLYKVLKLKFSNEDGTYEHAIFEPKQADFERTFSEVMVKGVKQNIPQPSGVESMMLLFKHAIDAINPTIAEAIDKGEKNLGAKDWNDLRKLVAKILDAGKGVSTKIKLVKKKNGEAIFPGFFAAVNRENKAYIRNNFIGPKVAFTSYETDRIRKEATATPTKAESYDMNVTTSAPVDTSGLDLEFDVDLGSL